MSVKHYKCDICEEEFRVIKKKPKCPKCGELDKIKRLLKAPNAKFMEKLDANKNKSRLKDSDKILKERARNHSRDNDLMDLALTNSTQQARDNRWLVENSDGTLRKRQKIDDL